MPAVASQISMGSQLLLSHLLLDLIALLLMRKRRLVYDGMVNGDARLMRLKGRPGGQEYQVVDPGLDEAAIAEATEELGRIMHIEDEA